MGSCCSKKTHEKLEEEPDRRKSSNTQPSNSVGESDVEHDPKIPLAPVPSTSASASTKSQRTGSEEAGVESHSNTTTTTEPPKKKSLSSAALPVIIPSNSEAESPKAPRRAARAPNPFEDGDDDGLQANQYRSLPLNHQSDDDRGPMRVARAEQSKNLPLVKAVAGQPGIHLSVVHSTATQKLLVTVVEARDLPLVNGVEPDVYAKAYLLPDYQNKQKTDVRKKTSHPVFNEKFEFNLTGVDLKTRQLQVSLLHHASLYKVWLVAEIVIDFAEFDSGFNFDEWLAFSTIPQDYSQPAVAAAVAEPQADANPFDDTPAAPVSVSSDAISRGDIQLSRSESEHGELMLTVHKARNLLPASSTGFSDPFIKLKLLVPSTGLTTNDGKVEDRKIKHQKRTLNPVWNETMQFPFLMPEVSEATFVLSVYDHEKKDFLGEAKVPVSKLDKTPQWFPLGESTTGQQSKALQKRLRKSGKAKAGDDDSISLSTRNTTVPDTTMASNDDESAITTGHPSGDVFLHISFKKPSNTLTISNIKARNLKSAHGTCDSYTKFYVLPDPKKKSKKKTKIFSKSVNPVYGETFAYHIPYEELAQRQLQVSVVNHIGMARNSMIGKTVIDLALLANRTDLSLEDWYTLR